MRIEALKKVLLASFLFCYTAASWRFIFFFFLILNFVLVVEEVFWLVIMIIVNERLFLMFNYVLYAWFYMHVFAFMNAKTFGTNFKQEKESSSRCDKYCVWVNKSFSVSFCRFCFQICFGHRDRCLHYKLKSLDGSWKPEGCWWIFDSDTEVRYIVEIYYLLTFYWFSLCRESLVGCVGRDFTEMKLKYRHSLWSMYFYIIR